MRSASKEILSIESALVREFNAGKIDRILRHFDPRVVGFSSVRQERLTGRAALRRTFNYYLHASPRMKYGISRPQVQVFGETAVATFYWTVELGRRRPRHTIRGRGSHIFAGRHGKWQIVHEHFSRAH